MKENNNNRGSMIILTVIGIATLLIAVIGATFAYFTVTIQGNPTAPNVTVQSKTLGVIEFETLNEIKYTNLIPGRPVWETDQTPTNKLNFTVTSAVDASSNEDYVVYLNVESNDFETDNVVYLLTETETGTHSVKGGQYFTDDNFVNHTFAGESTPTKLGFIKAGFTGKMKIGTAQLGQLGSKDKWEFEIWVNEIGAEQNEDQGKTITAYITIELADPTPQTNEKDYDPSKDITP